MKRAVAIFCIIIMAVLTLPVNALKPEYTKDFEWEVLKLTNNERTAKGITTLSTFESLQKVSAVRSEEIIEAFDHKRPDGTMCYTALDQNSIAYYSAAENIAAGYRTPEEVVDAWMHSEGHMLNIIDPNSKHLAIGLTEVDNEYGMYWVQFFVGGCHTTKIEVKGIIRKTEGVLDFSGAVLKVTCDMHGESYIPLENVKTELISEDKVKITYDGKTTEVVIGKESKPNITPELTPAKEFTDVPANAWYKQYVDYAVQNKMFSGTSEKEFSPNVDMTRAQFVQVLANIAGARLNNSMPSGFADAPAGKWFTGAVKWAVENGVASGVSATEFNPTGKIDRQQMCVMLVNYVENYKKETLSQRVAYKTFADDKDIAPWAKTAVAKCVKAGLVSGTGNNMFSPKTVANRATGATIFTNFHKNYIA